MCNCTNVLHKCTRQYPHSPVNNECSWCDMTSINYVFFWCVPLCEWIPISWNHGSDTVFALWTIVCQWVWLYMWLFAPGQRPSNDQNSLMFVQLVITFMNSVFCRYTKSLSRFNTVIKAVLYFTHAGVLALIRHVVFNTFLHVVFWAPFAGQSLKGSLCYRRMEFKHGTFYFLTSQTTSLVLLTLSLCLLCAVIVWACVWRQKLHTEQRSRPDLYHII